MNTAVVGAARVVFGADTVEFDSKAKGVEGVLGRLQDKFRELEQRLKTVGTGMTLGITVPFAAMVKSIDKGAGSFEAAMHRVRAGLQDASPEEIEKLAKAARTLGPAVNKGATEAADAIDALGRAGVSASDILGGALEATLKLSSAGMVDASEAAGLVTDVMGQFGKTSSDLPAVMTNVVGAMDATKFTFDDFRLALGQGGSIAAAAGVSFEDFATAIAATSTQFASGSDAGTSFKTYLQMLVGTSKEAKSAMAKLNISFFDANGAMKPMAEQAEILRTALKGLDAESRSNALTTIFGSDAARTAIGLMQQGQEGFEKYRNAVANGDVNAKVEELTKGSEAAGQRISVAWESVKISLGETGLLQITTSIKNAFAGMLESIANAPPLVLKIAAAFAGLVAALGPVLVVLGHLAAFLLPMIAARFGVVGLAISALINPLGTLAVVAGRLITAFSTGAIIARVGTMLASLLTPVGLVIAAVTVLSLLWQQHAARVAESEAAQARLRDTMNGAKPALDKAAAAIADMTGKTGAAAKAAREHANAMLAEARAAVVAAQAIAQKRLQVANEAAARADLYAKNTPRSIFADPTATYAGTQGTNTLRENARLLRDEAKAAADGLKEAQTQLGKLNEAINAPAPALQHINFEDDPKGRKGGGGSGRDTSYDAGNRRQLQDDLELEAARLRGDIEAERAIQRRLDLSRQIEAYQRTGLSLAQATAAANRDMATLDAARREGMAKDLERDEAAHQIELARITGNEALEDSLQRQQELKDRILNFQRTGLSLEEATARAIRQQLQVDEARAEIRARMLADDEQDRQLEMAKQRGDSEERIRALQREVDIRERIRELQGMDPSMSDAEARDRASREWDEMEKARQTGVFRDTFKDGVRAALDGDLKSWFKNWWRDRVAKGMEEALNSLADLISQLFSRVGQSGGGGGILGGIGNILGSVFGGGSTLSSNSSIGAAAAGTNWNDLPKFQNGGRFMVGGNAGIDTNLVSFRATAGEIVNIEKPGNDNGGSSGVTVNQKITFSGAMDLATKEEAIRFADAGRQAAINAINEANRRRG